MNRRLLERLLGTSILLAAGVLFIPKLLGEPVVRLPVHPEPAWSEEQPLPDLDLDIPRAREQPRAKPSEAGAQGDGILGLRMGDDTPESEAAVTVPAAAETAAGATLWVVQISSFKSRPQAEKLREKLRRGDYPAFIREARLEGVPWYQVRVGPEARREAVEQLRHRLHRIFSLEGIIARHEP